MNCGKPDDIDEEIIDEEIIRILWRDGRITMQELGRRVHLTGQAVKNRIERLEDLGIIQRYTVNVNCPVYGYKIHALIKVELRASQSQGFEDFINSGQYKIIHCYRVTGKPSYVVDVYFMSEEERDGFLSEAEKYGVCSIGPKGLNRIVAAERRFIYNSAVRRGSARNNQTRRRNVR